MLHLSSLAISFGQRVNLSVNATMLFEYCFSWPWQGSTFRVAIKQS